MNKRKFAWLLFMMGFSVLGIIMVQVIWIRNAVGIRNENFDYFVSKSIQEAASDIESSRKRTFFNEFMFSSPAVPKGGKPDISDYLSIGDISLNGSGELNVRITNQTVTREPGKEPVIIIHDTIIHSDQKAIRVKTSPQYRNPDEGVYMKQKEFVQWVQKRSDEFRNMSDQMISDIYQWEKTMEVDNTEIELALKRSLQYSGIDTPFEFAVINNGEVQKGSYKTTDEKEFMESRYMVRLFPDNIIRKDLIISVVFPGKTNYVLGGMVWILGGSLVFSLVILATFALSLFFIIRQKKVSEMRADFINNMTHEFKTPIATISLAADTITNSRVINDETKIRHFVGMIKKENSRMNRQVETILQIASLDKRDIVFRFGDVPVHSIIERAVEVMEIQAHQKGGVINLKLEAVDSVIYGDAEHLTNLVHNLLDNANKYSVGEPVITVSTVNRNDGIMLTVSDQGIGMTKAVQMRIFDRFYRQPAGNIHNVKGFGLGLSYVKSIVDAHKGTIEVTSEPGKGTQFDIYIPFNWDE
jgi:two-component system phosphate regulon sensor histidine kinase PhoR